MDFGNIHNTILNILRRNLSLCVCECVRIVAHTFPFLLIQFPYCSFNNNRGSNKLTHSIFKIRIRCSSQHPSPAVRTFLEILEVKGGKKKIILLSTGEEIPSFHRLAEWPRASFLPRGTHAQRVH